MSFDYIKQLIAAMISPYISRTSNYSRQFTATIGGNFQYFIPTTKPEPEQRPYNGKMLLLAPALRFDARRTGHVN
jgi:hypothetical protein